jgi:hypothetical protein
VLLASGVAVPISQLRAGDIVLATNVKTGKTSPEPVTAVMVKRDTDRYDLRIKTARRTTVIDTTRNHRFFDVTHDKWVRAGKLRSGVELRTAYGTAVTVAVGYTPRETTGWMWDISVPGGGDHDFYIDTTITTILVHNCPDSMSESGQNLDRNGFTRAGRAFQKHFFRGGFDSPSAAGFSGGTQAADVMNSLGQDTLDDILTNPQTATQEYGDVMDMKLPWGGARFINGIFDGFLTP